MTMMMTITMPLTTTVTATVMIIHIMLCQYTSLSLSITNCSRKPIYYSQFLQSIKIRFVIIDIVVSVVISQCSQTVRCVVD